MTAVPMTLAQPARADQPAASIVQILAHEDDDLLFMNPDLSDSITAGVPVTSIFLTAGEADGGVTYAVQRQQGSLAAYAQMLQVPCPNNTCWTREEVQVGTQSRHVVEHYALGSVNLYFLDLHDGGVDGFAPDNSSGALRRIWNGTTEPTLTMSNNGNWPQSYDRAGLEDVLTTLLSSSRPTLVRSQDPSPDPTLRANNELGFPAADHGDHPDHVSASWFADDAVDRYSAGSPGSYRVVVEHYRDYNIQDSMANLSGAETAGKRATFEDAYALHDPKLPWGPPANPAPSSCDPRSTFYQCWESRQRARTPRSSQSVTSGNDGSLHAFAVESGRLYEWTGTRGTWTGPLIHDQAPGRLAAGLSVGHDQDGRIEVLCQRADTGEIVSSDQQSGGGWKWGSLGSPDKIDPTNKINSDALQVSAPAVASNQDGRLQVFVRNRGGGISSAWQTAPNGGWSGWADMGGTGIQEAPAAFTSRDGRIELFAWAPGTAAASVLHWRQPAINQTLRRVTDLPVAPTSAPTVAMDRDGRLELLYRQIDSLDPRSQMSANSYTMTLWQISPGGGWTTTGKMLGGGPDQGGIGAPAAVTPGDGQIVAFVRNAGGGISVNRQNSPNGEFGDWNDLGGPGVGQIVGVPAASVDHGLADLVVLGLDGRMYDNYQNADGSFSSSNWKSMG